MPDVGGFAIVTRTPLEPSVKPFEEAKAFPAAVMVAAEPLRWRAMELAMAAAWVAPCN